VRKRRHRQQGDGKRGFNGVMKRNFLRHHFLRRFVAGGCARGKASFSARPTLI